MLVHVRVLSTKRRTYHLREFSFEVVDSDIVLDRLELGNQLNLRLNQGKELLLCEPSQLANDS